MILSEEEKNRIRNLHATFLIEGEGMEKQEKEAVKDLQSLFAAKIKPLKGKTVNLYSKLDSEDAYVFTAKIINGFRVGSKDQKIACPKCFNTLLKSKVLKVKPGYTQYPPGTIIYIVDKSDKPGLIGVSDREDVWKWIKTEENMYNKSLDVKLDAIRTELIKKYKELMKAAAPDDVKKKWWKKKKSVDFSS